MTGDYPNRSDLRGAGRAEFTGQTYGESAAQQRSQAVVPTGPPPSDVAAQRVATGVRPGARPLGRPTERTQEPITAGAPFGAGPGPMAAGIRPRVVSKDNIEIQLEQLYRTYPTEGVALLLDRIRTTRMNRGRIR